MGGILAICLPNSNRSGGIPTHHSLAHRTTSVWTQPCPEVGPVLTVPLEPSYTQLKSPNQGKTSLGLLVFWFSEDLA